MKGLSCALSGRAILSGQHNFPNHLSKWSDHAAEVTGRYPYIWGWDFGFSAEGKDAITGRDAMIEEAKRQYAAGSIITPPAVADINGDGSGRD